MFVRPWDKKSQMILRELSLNGRAYTFDTDFSRTFGRKHKQIFDKGLLDVASTRYSKRPDKTIFVTPPDVNVFEKITKRGLRYNFIKTKNKY